MTNNNKQSWREIAERILKEDDPLEFDKLLVEMLNALDAEDNKNTAA